MDMEQTIFEMIAHAGNAKSYCFEALNFAKNKNFKKSEDLMEKAKKELLLSHNVQTNLIHEESSGVKHEVSILLVHAQDTLMDAILAKDLITEFIDLYKNK